MFEIRKCFRNRSRFAFQVKRSLTQSQEQREGAGTQYTLCRGRSVPRLSPGPSPQAFVSASLQLSTICGERVHGAPKQQRETSWGWETVSFPQPSTISTFRIHHGRSYFSHPDEVGERKFWFDPFGHPWEETSGRGSVRASSTTWTWPPTYFLPKVRVGRPKQLQRRARKLTTTYDALRPLYSILLQCEPPRWENVFHSR